MATIKSKNVQGYRGPWRKARELTRDISAASTPELLAKGHGLRDQITRAAVSIMSNIAEGVERSGDEEFRQFIALAQGVISGGACATLCRSHPRRHRQGGS